MENVDNVLLSFNAKTHKGVLIIKLNEMVIFENSEVAYLYTNIDHASEEMKRSFPIYDKDHIGGLPMFAIITLGYDKGIIKPYYTSLYGTLGLDNDEDRLVFLTELIQDSIDIYNQNSEGYNNN